MTLLDAAEKTEYIISDIIIDDPELRSFLFSLGCYSGEPITIILRRKDGCIVSIKNARYHIDRPLAGSICVY